MSGGARASGTICHKFFPFHKTVRSEDHVSFSLSLLRVSDFDACKGTGARGYQFVRVGAGECDFTATMSPPSLSLSPHLISTGSLSASSPPLFSSRSLAARRHCVECEREGDRQVKRRGGIGIERHETQPAKGEREREKGKGRGCGGVPGRRCSSACRIALLASLPFPHPRLISCPRAGRASCCVSFIRAARHAVLVSSSSTRDADASLRTGGAALLLCRYRTRAA